MVWGARTSWGFCFTPAQGTEAKSGETQSRLTLIRARPWRIEPVAVGATWMSNSSVVDCQSLGLSADTNLCEVPRAQLHETLARLLRGSCETLAVHRTYGLRRQLGDAACHIEQILQRKFFSGGSDDEVQPTPKTCRRSRLLDS